MNNVRISESNLKPICSVRELAEILGLSRQHFYGLQKKGVFPRAVYDIRTRRPFYPLSLQKVCIEIRNSNIGYDGLPVLFYSCSRKHTSNESPRSSGKKRTDTPVNQEHLQLLEGLKAMGLVRVNSRDVQAALRVVCPGDVSQTDQGVTLRNLYRYLKGLA